MTLFRKAIAFSALEKVKAKEQDNFEIIKVTEKYVEKQRNREK